MRHKEFKEKAGAWGRKYGYAIRVIFDDFHTHVEVGVDEASYVAAHISNIFEFALETKWDYYTKITNHARSELFDILVEFAKTPLEDRKDEKRFIIPLPELVTTDGKQQYLTTNGSFFASRRDKDLRQIWREEHLKYVPEIYRQFAEEFDEEKKY